MTKKASDVRVVAQAARRVAAALLAVLLMCMALPASAQYATGGSGLHRSRIFWVDWGNDGENVFTGRTITRGFNVDTPASAANRLDITCTLSGATAEAGGQELRVYTPGDWQGDGLDNLYNVGGFNNGTAPAAANNPNTLSVGLRTGPNGRVAFDFSCSATLGGQPFTLAGLVFADAEASALAEHVAVRLTGGGQVRVIDQIAQCRSVLNERTAVTVATVGGFQEVRFGGATPTSCEINVTPELRAGPVLVGFIDGATSARVIVDGNEGTNNEGISAVAVGAVLDLEFSEAVPSTYGNAVHVRNVIWNGGVAASDVDYNNPTNLATISPGPRLGPTAEADQNANGPVGGPDVDALPKTTGPAGNGYANVAPPNVLPGGTYTISNIACNGATQTAQVAGWIDFNGNGVFDVGERSNTATCPAGAGSVSLTWTIPNDYLPQATSYLRLRLSPLADGVTNPSGVSQDGEAEDYYIALPKLTPQVRIAKVSQPQTGAFGFSMTNLTASSATLTTTTPGTAVLSAPADVVAAGTAVTLTENVPLTWALTSASCTDANASINGNPASFGTLAGAVLTIPSTNLRARADITCTFTNTRVQADLAITKTDGITQIGAGGTTTYTIRVTNNGPATVTGAVLTDPAAPGLTKTAAICSPSPGQCTEGTTPTLAQLEAGYALPALASGQFYEIRVTATVTATGQ